MSALALRGVSKRRGTGSLAVQAMENVSLELEPGEVVLLHGPSGSGKTTLLAVAAGLLAADAGEVLLVGRRVDDASQTARRRLRAANVGFVFQRSNLLGSLTARENVLLQAAIAGIDRESAEREADELLESLGVGNRATRRPGQLSGGEEQRVAVARALVHRPAVILADEPTGNLDSRSGHAVIGRLAELARARKAAVLVATHDPRLDAFATRIVRLVDGRIEAS